MGARTSTGFVAGILWASISFGCGAGAERDLAVDADMEGEAVDVAEADLSLRSGNLWTPLWTGLTRIPVCFTNGTTAQRTRVRSVAEGTWEAIGATTMGPNGRYGVDFSGWGTCPATPTGVIPITLTSGSTNETFGLGIAVQSMTLSTWAPDATIVHEFGHALGYTHEFLRSDYAAVDPACAETQGTPPDLAVTPVDTASIMNYEGCGRAGSITALDAFGHMALYGPWTLHYNQTVAIRHQPTWNYVRGDSTPDTSMSGIIADRELALVKVSNPVGAEQVRFGDSVRIRTHDGQFLKSNGRNALVTKTSTLSSATTWRVYGRISSGIVRVNDEVLFQASDGAYLRSNSSNRLTTDVGQFFHIAALLSALNL